MRCFLPPQGPMERRDRLQRRGQELWSLPLPIVFNSFKQNSSRPAACSGEGSRAGIMRRIARMRTYWRRPLLVLARVGATLPVPCPQLVLEEKRRQSVLVRVGVTLPVPCLLRALRRKGP